MNPQPSMPVTDPMLVMRLVFCGHYSECLDAALSMNWEGWTCVFCDDYQRPTWTALDVSEDAARCIHLLGSCVRLDAKEFSRQFYRTRASKVVRRLMEDSNSRYR